MNQITVTVDLTPRNLEILKQLCPDNVVSFKEKVAQLGLDKPPVPVPAPAAAKTEEPDQIPSQEVFPEVAQESASTAPTISEKDVKAVCLKMSKSGRADELRAAFAKFGAKKFSDVKPEDYPALMEELQNG